MGNLDDDAQRLIAELEATGWQMTAGTRERLMARALSDAASGTDILAWEYLAGFFAACAVYRFISMSSEEPRRDDEYWLYALHTHLKGGDHGVLTQYKLAQELVQAKEEEGWRNTGIIHPQPPFTDAALSEVMTSIERLYAELTSLAGQTRHAGVLVRLFAADGVQVTPIEVIEYVPGESLSVRSQGSLSDAPWAQYYVDGKGTYHALAKEDPPPGASSSRYRLLAAGRNQGDCPR